MQSDRKQPKGSVLVLVVAMLALLAVIGTVYITSARTERSSAAAMAAALNLDLAQDAVHTQVRDAMSHSLYDANGVLAGGWHEGGFGGHASRRWTMPEVGLTHGFGTSNDNPVYPDDTWLATNLHRDAYPLDTRYNDFSLLTPYAFNPAIGAYDPALPYYDPIAGRPSMPTLNVVADDSTATLDDAMVQLLPFSEASGVRYRFGVRIIDTSRMANFNRFAFSSGHVPTYDTYFGSIYDLRDDAVNGSPLGLAASPVVDNLSNELELRSYGNFGTPVYTNITHGLKTAWYNTLNNFDPVSGRIVGNYHRSFYTSSSYARELRPYMLTTDQFPNLINDHSAFTLTVPGGAPATVWPPYPRRVNTLAGSWGNDFSTANTLAAAATNIASAMEKIAGYSHEEACAFAINYISYRWNSWSSPYAWNDPNATNDWNILHRHQHVIYKKQVHVAYDLLDGLPFIDDQGICYPSSRRINGDRPPPYALGGNNTPDLRAPPGKIYFGYSAQPFINEIAVHQTTPGKPAADDDFAIEFYNPYYTMLSLKGYQLRLNDGKSISLDSYFVPGCGYLVITRKGDQLAKKINDDNAYCVVNPELNLNGCGKIYLMREYIRRGAQVNEISYAAIDEYGCSELIDPVKDIGRANGDYYLRRSNYDIKPKRGEYEWQAENFADLREGPYLFHHPLQEPEDLYRWCATVHDAPVAEFPQLDDPKKPEHMTLGTGNPTDSVAAIRLFDRFADHYAGQRSPLYYAQEFSQILRISHVCDAATGLPSAESGVLSTQLNALIKNPQPQVLHTQFPADASVHFDFRTPPWVYRSIANTGPDESAAPAELPYPTGDLRAMRLLECISLASEDLRIPAQLNVNTASAEVLQTIPVLQTRPDLVGAILAYRWRTTSLDTRIPPLYRSPYYDYSDSLSAAAKFPGYGIRSLGELEVPLSLPFPQALSIDQRDAFWGNVVNMCTVRSDTFVLYGYLEAVSKNPRYAGPFDNAQIWYQTGPAITSDPADSTAPLLRLARRRWVSLIDGSEFSASRVRLDGLGLDPNFKLPRIAAIKNLPH